ncbi:MAG: YkgJ family cysteine cluster protein [Candidatus Woesearchaeota archaeon]
MTTIHELVESARSSLGPTCYGICQAKCCKRGKLLLDSSQVPIVAKGSETVLRRDGYYELSLSDKGCPNLTSDHRCGIFTHEKRPLMCAEYPLFIRGKYIFVASACTGFARGELDVYLTKMKELGFTVIVQ